MKKLLLVLLCLAMPVFQVMAERPVNHEGDDAEQWISIGADAMTALRKEFDRRHWTLNAQPHITNPDIYLLQVNEQQVIMISRLMHKLFNRCGGFIAHNSYTDAVESNIAELNTTTEKAISYTLDRATQVNAVTPTLTEQGIKDTITSLSNFTTRYYTSSTAVDASNWLKNKWQTMAAGRSDISVQLFPHSWAMPSVILTITGAHQPQDIVVMGGHLDSINQSGTIAPGADDDASGIATLTEILRAVLASGYVPSRTIKIMGYAAEEVGLRGSADIATAAKNNNDNIIGVLQLDMTNYKGAASDINLMTDYTSAAQNTFVANLVDTYTGASRANGTCGYACSDHASWNSKGYAASMPFESTLSTSNPNIHTANDTLAFMNNSVTHSMKFAKLGVAYMIEMGKGGLNGNPGTDPGPVGGGTTPTSTELINNVSLTNQSNSAGQSTLYFVTVPTGASNLVITTTGSNGDADLYVKAGVAPTTSSYDLKSDGSSSNETVTVATPVAGRYYVLVNAYTAYSGLSVKATYTTGGGGGCTPVSWTKTNLSAARSAWLHNTITIPACNGTLTTNMSGGTGDGDMYVRQGSQPTTSTYNCRPYKTGNTESCTITNPGSGIWYVSIRAYSAFSGVTLSASFQ